jgi:hypothetical protein
LENGIEVGESELASERHEASERTAGLPSPEASNEIQPLQCPSVASPCAPAAGRESRGPFIGKLLNPNYNSGFRGNFA